MAVAFENCNVVLSQECTEHINEHHVRSDSNTRASKFKSFFNLSSCFARLAKRTWHDSNIYEIIEQGFKQGHGQYYMYLFTLQKVISADPCGFPSRKICINYSSWHSTDERFHIITAYPYSAGLSLLFETVEEWIFHAVYSTQTNGSFRSHHM